MLSAILDHLWQSTLVALAVGVLITAVFRKAPAGVRYGLWFAASLKFLVPFAALTALGRFLAPAGLAPAGAAPEAALIERTARPLAQFPFAHDAVLQAPVAPAALTPAPLVQAHAPSAIALPIDPILLVAAVWALGSTVVIVRWAVRWERVRRIARSAVPIDWPAPMPVRASSSLMEPGLIGLFRPVLVVPQTLPERLTRSEIEAILAHEVSHLRRRDNLTAALHMLVEALFWFHPMVWWIGARMIAEREQACDEAVVRAGHDRATYARSLVESCRLFLQSPLSCVAGASGSDLKTRVQAIMTAPPSSPLSPLKKALLIAAGGCAFATPVAAGLLTSPEGQKAVRRATAVARSALDAGATGTPDADAAKPVRLARNERILAPALTVARLAAQQTPLSRDVAEPRIEAPPAAAAPPPVQVATAAPPPARVASAPTARAPSPAEAKKQAADFVKSYAAATPFHTIGRWADRLCINVAGLSFQQGAAVRDRVAEAASNLGLPAKGECEHANVEIGFTNDPQAMLDNAVRTSKVNPLGDRTSDTRTVKTVTLPIQAWYITNGELYSENERSDATGGDLKVRVLYQPPTAGTGAWPAGVAASANPSPGNGPGNPFPLGGGPTGGGEMRAFTNVLVIVDLRKTGDRSLGLLADYAAMLALSQPRALGQCSALSSITDLFAACPGRPAPEGLTPADTAYLTALYTAEGAVLGSSHQSHVVQRMADLLVDPQAGATKAAEERAIQTARASRCMPRVVVRASHINAGC